jgi:tRNA nucleotidyltransferase (CCA-adding enzyme)
MSEAQYFKEFCDNLIIGTENRSTISTRYKAITNRLNTDFWNSPSETLFSRYVGSYGRNTSIKNESDIDMIFVLPAHMKTTYDIYTYNGQSALLQVVSKSIQKTYSTSKVGADGQVVSVVFTDGVNFEVVPAFENNDKSYTHPDANDGGSWKKNKPSS